MRINFLKSFSWRRWLSDHLFYFSLPPPSSNLSCSLWVYVSFFPVFFFVFFLLLVEILLTKLGTLLKKLYTNVSVCLNLFLINFKIIFRFFLCSFPVFSSISDFIYIYIIYFQFVWLDFVLRKKNGFPYRLNVLVSAIFMEQNTYVLFLNLHR